MKKLTIMIVVVACCLCVYFAYRNGYSAGTKDTDEAWSTSLALCVDEFHESVKSKGYALVALKDIEALGGELGE